MAEVGVTTTAGVLEAPSSVLASRSPIAPGAAIIGVAQSPATGSERVRDEFHHHGKPAPLDVIEDRPIIGIRAVNFTFVTDDGIQRAAHTIEYLRQGSTEWTPLPVFERGKVDQDYSP